MKLPRFLLVVVVPPTLSTTLAISAYVLGGGRDACFEDLDLDTPGLVCATFFHVVLAITVFIALHLAIALPVALFLRRVCRSSPARMFVAQRWTGHILLSVFSLWVAGIVLVQTASGPRWPAGLLDLLLPAVVQITLVVLLVGDSAT